MIIYENKLAKYLNRMFEVVQCKNKKYVSMSEDGIFKELDKVIGCQLKLDPSPESMQMENDLNGLTMTSTRFTNIPLVDIVINIDLFTAQFEDRNKVLRIVKELFNHCTTMKKLLLKHGKLILPALLRKYDK